MTITDQEDDVFRACSYLLSVSLLFAACEEQTETRPLPGERAEKLRERLTPGDRLEIKAAEHAEQQIRPSSGAPRSRPPVTRASVAPGTSVTRKGRRVKLLGTPIALGAPLPAVPLVDARTGEEVDLSRPTGRVRVLSLVPSLETRVCEAQTHALAEGRAPAGIERITISRDLPFAQARFARDSRLTNVRYLSDYRAGAFGRALGLLMEGSLLLARSVIVVGKQGKVRYIQVVPDSSKLPDMATALARAAQLQR